MRLAPTEEDVNERTLPPDAIDPFRVCSTRGICKRGLVRFLVGGDK